MTKPLAFADCVWQAMVREFGDQTGVLTHAEPSEAVAPEASSTSDVSNPVADESLLAM